MEKEKFNDSCETDKDRVIDTAKKYIPSVICYLALNEETYPRCCRQACSLLGLKIKEDTGISGIKMCRGSLIFNSENRACHYHAWLQYDDTIIDPMDFQFNTVDEDDLPFTDENIIPEDISKLQGLSQDDMDKVFMKTWLANAEKRYLENPNEKEKYFQHLNELLKAGEIDTVNYYLEIKRCFGIKTFYDANDKDRIYTANHVEPVILNKNFRKIARLFLGKW